MDLDVVRGDITAAQVDAVVNAANSALTGGGGVDAAIHRAAGPIMDTECRALRQTEQYRGGLPTGQAVATSGGQMAARWVIHTVGPIYGGPEPRRVAVQQEQLRACYVSCLAVADQLGASSIAFPLISAGAYGWPRRDAIEQALGALCGADSQVEKATLVLFDDKSYQLARHLLRD
ncbi:O-acetyl-ADP-ribose deacetylase (regulator of RNase III) [Nakamurella sp. UYEF19]|uniref:O-acetyl-ADP-ribose deacetylase n=1 Tax=Nakamurella sp. UYEF19 TaxID=1756392 RepID=UPI003390805E